MVKKGTRIKGHHPHVLQLLVIAIVVGSIGAYVVNRGNAGSSYAQISIASYNVLGAGSKSAPGFNSAHKVTAAQRAVNVTKVINGASYDVMGLQELDANKVDSTYSMFTYVKDRLPNYTFYPSSNQDDHSSQRAIIYKTKKYTRVDTGIMKYPYQDAPYVKGAFQKNDGAPWVLLKDKGTDKAFYVLNVHMISMNNSNCRYDCNPPGTPGGSDSGGAQKRAQTARLIYDWVAAHDNKYPVIVTGDMNSTFKPRNTFDDILNGDRAKLPYCIVTNNGLLKHVGDIYNGRRGHCPNNVSASIDHIYVSSPRILVYGEPVKRKASPAPSASDHFPFQATLRIPRK